MVAMVGINRERPRRFLATALSAAAGAVVLAAAGAQASDSPVLAASPSSSSASPIVLAAGSSRTVTFTNNGGVSTSVLRTSLSASPSNAGFTISSDLCSGVALGPMKSCSVTVSYHGAAPRSIQTAVLILASKKELVSISSYFRLDTPPIANADSFSITETAGQTYPLTFSTGSVLANDTDPDGDLLAVTNTGTVTLSDGNSLTLHSDGSFSYMVNHAINGQDVFDYTVSDGAQTSSSTVTFDVKDAQPVAVDDSYSATANKPLTADAAHGVLANDAAGGGGTLSAFLVSGPSHGTLLLNADGSFTYTPAAGFTGTDSFTYQASDGILTSNVATVTIRVTDTPPVAVNDSYTGLANQPLTVTAGGGVLANDAAGGGGTLSAFLVSGPSHGTLLLNADGSFTYTPAAGFTGTDSFTYKASDGINTSNVATVTIRVTDTPPVAVNDSYTGLANQPLTVTAGGGVLANDAAGGGGTLSAFLASGPSHGTLALNADGSFTYTPAAGFTGTDSFTYKASD